MKWQKGFSLVEVVLALGIVAFALMAVLGMFPVALGAAKESTSETHAAMIAQMVFGEIRAVPPSAAFFPSGSNATAANQVMVLTNSLAAAQPKYAVFDESGQPISQSSSTYFNDPASMIPATKALCAYQAMIRAEPDVPAPGVTKLTLTITYPGSVPLAARKSYIFVTAVKNTDS